VDPENRPGWARCLPHHTWDHNAAHSAVHRYFTGAHSLSIGRPPIRWRLLIGRLQLITKAASCHKQSPSPVLITESAYEYICWPSVWGARGRRITATSHLNRNPPAGRQASSRHVSYIRWNPLRYLPLILQDRRESRKWLHQPIAIQ
jgi:hypothetical protein